MSGRKAKETWELLEAGWEQRGSGPGSLWRRPEGGRWWAHHQAIIELRWERLGPSEDLAARGEDEGQRRVGVSEEDRLRRAVERLMEGQEEALGIVRAALEAGDGARTDDALPDLQDVLEGALEDARADLGIEEGGTA